MNLNTYSAILSFAIELEDKMRRYYETVSEFDEAFAENAKRYAKRKQRMTQIRQDHVTEMVLEPINGLVRETYETALRSVPGDRQAAIAQAIILEANVHRFYVDAGDKMNVTEVIRAFLKFGNENAEHIIDLRALATA